MINVGRVVNSRNLAQPKPFIVWRKAGDWVEGRFVQTENPIPMSGVVTAAGTEDIMQVPEGDRVSQIVVFHSTLPLYVTHDDVEGKGTSDEIEWHGQRYRLFQGKDWSDFGYYRMVGTSMGGT
ncbi:hypothetical protein E4K67_22440 [Desulfosporosinus fructosivorans]|uniref:Uncharacterized protein n=1 Tax=Desulfosporosinus fructosivorans TaxID=2018669 RepID=A0A4Z0QZD5_9FIRM|nr:hypothetical protein [Desulfosporosinus fructosivorans]TGE35878.1 hypothetical protein E4K67_22440 [Desulfosporosinus fructosivorans]